MNHSDYEQRTDAGNRPSDSMTWSVWLLSEPSDSQAAAVVLNEVDQPCRHLSYEALNQHRSELTAPYRITIIALHAIPEVERIASWVCNWNGSRHRAAGKRSPLANRAIGGSVCTALLSGDLRWQLIIHHSSI